jgi:hypothetical protein
MKKLLREWGPVFLILLMVLLIFIIAEVWGAEGIQYKEINIPQPFKRYTSYDLVDGQMKIRDSGIYVIVTSGNRRTKNEVILFKIEEPEDTCGDCPG